MTQKTISLEYMSRIEGEAGLRVNVQDGKVSDLKLTIPEPPRFFEAILRGRSLHEVPDITARICGICPVAYQMSAAQALETALGLDVPRDLRRLRRLLYCGEWIQSHALHIYLLQAPDFFGVESAITLAGTAPAAVERGLKLKKIGNELMEVIGGRSVHPISVCVGGFHKVPRRRDLLALRDRLQWALDASLETARLVATLPLPDFTADYEFVALSHPTEYAINEGYVISSGGLSLQAREFEEVFLEEHVAHSTALHSVRADRGSSYFVGPLARINLNHERLGAAARAAAAECKFTWPCRNPYAGIAARTIELAEACEQALALVNDYQEPAASRLEFRPHAGEGCAATEAPRGTLYHRYRISEQGLVEFAKIVPPTAQNLRRMEDDLRLLLPGVVEKPDQEIVMACEKMVRNYDPCISCSAHFLQLDLRRRSSGFRHGEIVDS